MQQKSQKKFIFFIIYKFCSMAALGLISDLNQRFFVTVHGLICWILAILCHCKACQAGRGNLKALNGQSEFFTTA